MFVTLVIVLGAVGAAGAASMAAAAADARRRALTAIPVRADGRRR